MGSPEDKGDGVEYPQRLVYLPAFYMSKYLITQEQYKAIKYIKRKKPFRFKGSEKLPATEISWFDGKYFCEKLSKKAGRKYQLPSEAQWEYACRAGTTTPFYFGETITTDLANFNGHSSYGEAAKGICRRNPTIVGTFPPNAFGLYDMHGNVKEWCEDSWQFDKPELWVEGAFRVLRGGSHISNARQCLSASRSSGIPFENYFPNGLRIIHNI